jgi:hypothetical protein
MDVLHVFILFLFDALVVPEYNLFLVPAWEGSPVT